jgi:phosphatidylserine/phosphatidylglycerophosphate/cardiolipin synthase-like enzyme/uncharacterized membrane protein YdjX (TVP38/TMEM64 family)
MQKRARLDEIEIPSIVCTARSRAELAWKLLCSIAMEAILPDSARIARPGHNCWRVARASRVAFLVDAASYFEALAGALARAERTVFILGWDIHSALRLHHAEDGALPCQLGALLDQLAQRRPNLRIRILDWDFNVLLALGREALPWVTLDERTHRRIQFRLDGRHPVGASHHQKVVVIDDAIAFSGGIDLTAGRWDTPAHEVADARRCDEAGKPHEPFHDIQIAVDGEAARALGALARERWLRASGRSLRWRRSSRRQASDPWPRELAPDLEDVEVAIARAEPAYQGREEVREVERLYLDAIASAQRSIYIENQYLTSTRIGDALCASLGQPEGPDVVIVSPRECSGWLEQTTMGVLRERLVRRLREADRHARLHILRPRLPGDAVRLNVHSKLMIVDARSARVGSANLSNRSMGLDTECDVLVESAGDPRIERGIRRLLARLLAEHLGAGAEQVERELAANGDRALAAIERFGGGERTLVPLDVSVPEWTARLVPDSLAADPERPFAAMRVVEEWTPEELRDPRRRSLLPLLAVVVLAFALAAAWRFSDLSLWLEPASVRAWLAGIAGTPLAPLAVVGLYAAGAALVLPLAPLVLATLLLFDGAEGAALVTAGVLVNAALGYAIGRFGLGDLVRRALGRRLAMLRARLAVPSLLGIALLRLLPVAPFTMVSVAAGSARARFDSFLLGTLLGVAPGVLLLMLLSHGTRRAWLGW